MILRLRVLLADLIPRRFSGRLVPLGKGAPLHGCGGLLAAWLPSLIEADAAKRASALVGAPFASGGSGATLAARCVPNKVGIDELDEIHLLSLLRPMRE
jgi:hypothetical protein